MTGGQLSISATTLDEFVLIPRAYLADKLLEIKELEERMDNLKNDTEYTLVQKDQEMDEKLKMVEMERTREKRNAAEKYDQIVEKLAKAHHQHDDALAVANSEFERRMKELDHQYEDRLMKEYDKQNRLLNEVQNLRERHRSETEQIERRYEEQIVACVQCKRKRCTNGGPSMTWCATCSAPMG